MWRIGYLEAGPRPADGAPPGALRQALKKLGYVDGKNVTYVGRCAGAEREQLLALASELIAMKVDVVVTLGGRAASAVMVASSTMPVVFIGAADPEGVVGPNLARPIGNATGFTDNATELSAKRLQILKEFVPGISRIADLPQP